MQVKSQTIPILLVGPTNKAHSPIVEDLKTCGAPRTNRKNKKAETSMGFGFSHKIFELSLRSVGSFSLFNQEHEGCLIMNCQLRQLLAIHLDTGCL